MRSWRRHPTRGPRCIALYRDCTWAKYRIGRVSRPSMALSHATLYRFFYFFHISSSCSPKVWPRSTIRPVATVVVRVSSSSCAQHEYWRCTGDGGNNSALRRKRSDVTAGGEDSGGARENTREKSVLRAAPIIALRGRFRSCSVSAARTTSRSNNTGAACCGARARTTIHISFRRYFVMIIVIRSRGCGQQLRRDFKDIIA